jgi:predicted trehalose synthase
VIDTIVESRWFRRRDGERPSLEVSDEFRFPDGGGLRIVEASWPTGRPERYAVLSSDAATGSERAADSVGLLRWAARGRPLHGQRGRLRPVGTQSWIALPPPERGRALDADQSNTNHVVDERILVKWLRHLVPGPHPEAEMTTALAAAGFEGVPRSGGAVEYRAGRDEPATVALIAEFVPEAQSAWEILDRQLDAGEVEQAERTVAEAARTLARMHAAAAEAFGWGSAARATCVAEARAELEARAARVSETRAETLPPVAVPPGPERMALTRVHGDVHLAQFLLVGERCLMIDFEGDPVVAQEERRRRASPLYDLACLRWSISLALHWRGTRGDSVPPDAAARLRERALEAYMSAAPARVRLPAPLLFPWLHLFELVKASRELVYARTYLPSWEEVAARGLEELRRSAS